VVVRAVLRLPAAPLLFACMEREAVVLTDLPDAFDDFTPGFASDGVRRADVRALAGGFRIPRAPADLP